MNDNIQSLKTLKFIQKRKNIHNNKYDYSLVDYIDVSTKVKIICKEHGVFEQSPRNHLKGFDCILCGRNKISEKKSFSQEQFILKRKSKHNNKYDYSLVKYKNTNTNIDIICPKHGIFSQNPRNHLKGSGCSKCYHEKQTITKEDFINRSNKTHNNKYNYSLVEYKGCKTKIKIICPIHGVLNNYLIDIGEKMVVQVVLVVDLTQKNHEYFTIYELTMEDNIKLELLIFQ